MTDEKKQQLFPYFAYMYSQQLDPEKYGSVSSIDEWSNLIQDNQNDMNQITNAASQLTDEEWDDLEKEYSTESSAVSDQNVNQDAAYAKKGAKLKKLKDHAEMMKKGGKKKKCECGCEVVTKKENGGQLVDACSCCGKVHNNIVKAAQGTKVDRGTSPVSSTGNFGYYQDKGDAEHYYYTDKIAGQFQITNPEQLDAIKKHKVIPKASVQVTKSTTQAPNRIASQPQPNANGDLPSNFIGSAAHPKTLPEVTVTAKDLSKKKVTQAPTSKTTATNRVGSTNTPATKPATKTNVPAKSTVVAPITTTKPTVKNRVGATPTNPVVQDIANTNKEIRERQQALIDAGFNIGKTGVNKNGVDGSWGALSKKAWLQHIKNKEAIAQHNAQMQTEHSSQDTQLARTRGAEVDNAPFVAQRQGFDPTVQSYYNSQSNNPTSNFQSIENERSTPNLYSMNNTPIVINKKGGLIKKKQAGGSSESASSQMGVAKKGAKMKPKERIKGAQQGTKISKGPVKPYSSSQKDSVINSWTGKTLPTTTKDTPKGKIDVPKTTDKNKGKFLQKGGKAIAQRDSVTAYNRINSTESDSGKGPQSSKAVLESTRKGNYGPGNTKKDYDKSLKDTKAINKKETGGKAPVPSKNLPLKKSSLKKEEKRNAEISKPDRIGKAKIVKKVKTKKC